MASPSTSSAVVESPVPWPCWPESATWPPARSCRVVDVPISVASHYVSHGVVTVRFAMAKPTSPPRRRGASRRPSAAPLTEDMHHVCVTLGITSGAVVALLAVVVDGLPVDPALTCCVPMRDPPASSFSRLFIWVQQWNVGLRFQGQKVPKSALTLGPVNNNLTSVSPSVEAVTDGAADTTTLVDLPPALAAAAALSVESLNPSLSALLTSSKTEVAEAEPRNPNPLAAPGNLVSSSDGIHWGWACSAAFPPILPLRNCGEDESATLINGLDAGSDDQSFAAAGGADHQNVWPSAQQVASFTIAAARFLSHHEVLDTIVSAVQRAAYLRPDRRGASGSSDSSASNTSSDDPSTAEAICVSERKLRGPPVVTATVFAAVIIKALVPDLAFEEDQCSTPDKYLAKSDPAAVGSVPESVAEPVSGNHRVKDQAQVLQGDGSVGSSGDASLASQMKPVVRFQTEITVDQAEPTATLNAQTDKGKMSASFVELLSCPFSMRDIADLFGMAILITYQALRIIPRYKTSHRYCDREERRGCRRGLKLGRIVPVPTSATIGPIVEGICSALWACSICLSVTTNKGLPLLQSWATASEYASFVQSVGTASVWPCVSFPGTIALLVAIVDSRNAVQWEGTLATIHLARASLGPQQWRGPLLKGRSPFTSVSISTILRFIIWESIDASMKRARRCSAGRLRQLTDHRQITFSNGTGADFTVGAVTLILSNSSPSDLLGAVSENGHTKKVHFSKAPRKARVTARQNEIETILPDDRQLLASRSSRIQALRELRSCQTSDSLSAVRSVAGGSIRRKAKSIPACVADSFPVLVFDAEPPVRVLRAGGRRGPPLTSPVHVWISSPHSPECGGVTPVPISLCASCRLNNAVQTSDFYNRETLAIRTVLPPAVRHTVLTDEGIGSGLDLSSLDPSSLGPHVQDPARILVSVNTKWKSLLCAPVFYRPQSLAPRGREVALPWRFDVHADADLIISQIVIFGTGFGSVSLSSNEPRNCPDGPHSHPWGDDCAISSAVEGPAAPRPRKSRSILSTKAFVVAFPGSRSTMAVLDLRHCLCSDRCPVRTDRLSPSVAPSRQLSSINGPIMLTVFPLAQSGGRELGIIPPIPYRPSPSSAPRRMTMQERLGLQQSRANMIALEGKEGASRSRPESLGVSGVFVFASSATSGSPGLFVSSMRCPREIGK